MQKTGSPISYKMAYNDPYKVVYNDPSKMVYNDPEWKYKVVYNEPFFYNGKFGLIMILDSRSSQ